MSDTACVFNIQRYSIHDGPGIRTVVFFKGCSLRCRWCANPESIPPQPLVFYSESLCSGCDRCIAVCPSQAIETDHNYRKKIDYSKCLTCGECTRECPSSALRIIGKNYTVEELVKEVKKDAPFYTESSGGVTLSGGEPLLQDEFAVKLLKRLNKAAIHTAIETGGNVPLQAVEKVLSYTDLFLFDLKHVDSCEHKRLTGAPNQQILENLRYIAEAGGNVQVRTPIIPGYNDSPEVIDGIARIANELSGISSIELLPYHNYGQGKYAGLGQEYRLDAVIPPTKERMYRLKETLEKQVSIPIIYKE